MTHRQHRLSVLLITALLCPIPWVYGGAKKQQGKPLGSSVPAVSVQQERDHQQAELAALNAGARSPWVGDDRQQAQALFAGLKQRGIAIKSTFYKMLGLASLAQRSQLVSRCQAFFDSVDTKEISNTGCLTSMIQKKAHVCAFLLHSDDTVSRVAKTPALRSLTSLFNKRGFPRTEEDTQAFIEWDLWWRGEGGRRILDQELLRAFSSMFSGRGLPDKKAVEDYLRLDIWWQGEGKAQALDRELLRTFSSMFNRRGLPDKKAVEDYLQLDIWWQGEGRAQALDRDLLRAFSSMFSGRGLPDKKAVEDYLQLDIWWQGEGKARTWDRKLLSVFSSMFNGKGLPDKKAVKDYLRLDIWWQGEGKARTLDRELLRAFSSMFNGRGLPDKKAVEHYLQLDVWWQGEGKARALDRELLRAFSSMFHGRGLPDKKTVEDYLRLDVWWQEEGQARALDRELLRAFSSMFCGRGLPDKKAVEDYLQLDIWWQGEDKARTLDRELLRAFSSMFNSRGLPDKKTVENYLQLDVWWQGEGQARTLNRELLRAFSSMFCGRGLPDKKAVEDYLQLDIWWQGEGKARTLDRQLLRAFSSMFSSRGLPDKKAIEDYLQLDVWWQGESKARTLDRQLLRAFSSMFCGRGLPNKKAVEDYLRLDVWWQEKGQARTLDRELLRVFSSMFNGRGLPGKKVVEEYLQWECWQQQGEGNTRILDGKLLRAFSSMFSGRGLPDKLRTDEIMQWLSWKDQWNRSAIKVMGRLYSGAYAGHGSLGLPDINKLRQAEQKLTAFIPVEEHNQDENDGLLPLIKIVALYLANDGGTRQLSWTDCDAWLQEYSGFLAPKDVFRRLLLTLHYHGGRGVKEVMALISGKPEATKRFVLNALGRGYAVAAVQYALEAIEPSEWREYLFFTRGLHPVPDRQQWQTIRSHLKTLALVWPNQEYQRRFLTLIWPLSPTDRERFVQPDALQGLITLLPSVQVMRQLSKSLTTVELRILFDTCLAYRAGQPDKQGLPILFKALLLARLPLFGHGAIPPGILAQTHDQPEGVVIGVNPTIGIKDSVTLFIQVMAVILGEFWDCEYTVNGPTLTLWPHGSTVPITLPTPDLAWHPDGVQIRHWTLADLHRFYQATECWSGVYREPLESNEPEQDPIAARLVKKHRNRTVDVKPQGERPVPYLSVAMLRGIVKNRVPMNAVAWASADHHKDTLPPSLLAQLKERANADNDGLVPESLKMFLSGRDQRSQISVTDPDQVAPNSPTTWLETVLRQSVLSEADIDQLYTYRDQLTSDQVVDILFRMDQSVSQDTRQRWYSLLDDKHQQTLKTNPPWLDGSNQAMETVHDIEDILRDLFPDALLSMP